MIGLVSSHAGAVASRPFGRAAGARRGAILVGVLWVLVLIAFLAVVLRLHMGAVVTSVRVTEDKAAARIVAEAGLARVAALVRAGPEDGVGPLPDQLGDEVETSSGRVSVTLTNESRRVDLNTAEKPLILGILRAAGASDSLAESIATTVLKRRPTNGQPTDPQGETPAPAAPAQESQPQAADALQSIAELALVHGMTDAIAIAAEPLVTVSSGLPGIRLDAAEERLLRAIPDLPAPVVSAIARYRAGKIDHDELGSILEAVPYHTTQQAITWRARLSVELPSGHGEEHEALITISPDDSAPYRIVDWRRITDGQE